MSGVTFNDDSSSDGGAVDKRLADLGKRFQKHREEAAKRKEAVKPKRGPGRPRKNPAPVKKPEPAPAGSSESESDEASDAAEEQPDKIALVRKIKQMQKKLHAVGTGLNPTTAHSVQELSDELALLNLEVNERRGGDAVKRIIIDMVAPAAEYGCNEFVPPDQLDLRGLREEVKENFDEYFGEAATQVAINYSEYFSVGPVGELAKSFAGCAVSCNAKNQMRRRRHMKEMEAERERQDHPSLDPYADMNQGEDPDLDADDKPQ